MITEQSTNTPSLQLVQPHSEASPLSIDQVVSNLQLLLAIRRVRRSRAPICLAGIKAASDAACIPSRSKMP